MNADRLIPEGGTNPYADHPGFTAVCRLRITTTQRSAWGGMQGGGFACEMTGGHCVPDAQCEARRQRADDEDALAAMCTSARAIYPNTMEPA